MINTVLLVLALVCFVFATLPGASVEPNRSRLIAAGLAFLAASMIRW